MVAQPTLTTQKVAGQTLSDRVRPFLAEIAARATQTEQARCVPRENMDIIRDAGFVRAFVPASCWR